MKGYDRGYLMWVFWRSQGPASTGICKSYGNQAVKATFTFIPSELKIFSDAKIEYNFQFPHFITIPQVP
jgi:hypothetical protein